MTRDEILYRLATARAGFEARLSEIRLERLDVDPGGGRHSVKDIVAHVTAYDQLICDRLASASHGAKTTLEADRMKHDMFEEETWVRAAHQKSTEALVRSKDAFRTLVHSIEELSDEELSAQMGPTAALDESWLNGRAPWEAILGDSADHYVSHYADLDAAIEAEKAAAGSSPGSSPQPRGGRHGAQAS